MKTTFSINVYMKTVNDDNLTNRQVSAVRDIILSNLASYLDGDRTGYVREQIKEILGDIKLYELGVER